jgi:PAS domain-containing protein
VTLLANVRETGAEPFGVLLVNRRALVISCNPAAAEILGLPPHDLIATSLYRLFVLTAPLGAGMHRLLMRDREESAFLWVQSSPLLLDGLHVLLVLPLASH